MKSKIKDFFYQIIIVKPITSVLSIIVALLLCYFLLNSNYYDKYIDCDLKVEIIENNNAFRIDKSVFDDIKDKSCIHFFYEGNKYVYYIENFCLDGSSYYFIVNGTDTFFPENTYPIKIFIHKDKLLKLFV